MRVELRATYEAEPDKYFWLREPPDGSEVDVLRRQVAAVYAELSPGAFMMLDAAIAGERQGAAAVRRAIPDVPEDIAGVPARQALSHLADALAAAPQPPKERRLVVEDALESLDVPRMEGAISWVAEALGFAYAADATVKIEVYVVASGVPLGGLTGFRIDDSPVCFVSVRGQEGSTFCEALIHEATHVLDIACASDTSLVAQLRAAPESSHQLWHAPYFVAAAEATRRFVDAGHTDFGDTHGYYAKVPEEMATLTARGIIEAIRNS
jgi:hypothetical protein